MARKKLSKVLAWTLAAIMAVSPVNMTWASESADLFSDNSENAESAEMPADETDSPQQEEQDTRLVVSDGEENENSLTAEDLEEVFSAGEQASNVDASDPKIIKGEENFNVRSNETFIFKPTTEATYRISTNENYNLDIRFSESYSMTTENYYTMKTGPGHTYTIKVLADTESDIPVEIKQVAAVESISVDTAWPESVTYPVERVIKNEIDNNLPVTLQLKGGTQVKGEYAYQVAGYGDIGIVYEDSQHNLMWKDGDSTKGSERPTESGTYTYHFYCKADPSAISGPYTMNLRSFEELFQNNKVEKNSDGTLKVSFNKDGYVKTNSHSDTKYNYGFILKPETDITYYADFKGCLIINNQDQDGKWNVNALYEPDSFTLQAGTTYYIIWETHEPLDGESDGVKIEATLDTINTIEWVKPPTETFIEDYMSSTNLGVKVEVTYKDSNKKEFSWGDEDEQLGTLKCYQSIREDGRYYLHYYFSKNPSIGIEHDINMVNLSDVENSIPEVTVGKKSDNIKRNYNNYNVFKFKASEDGAYAFDFTGTPVSESDTESGYVIKGADGTIKGSTECYYFNEENPLSLAEGDTVYIYAGPYGDDFTVNVSKKTIVTNISLENQQELPTLYDKFLQSAELEDMKRYLKNAKFKIDFSNGTSNTVMLGDKIEGYGKLCIFDYIYDNEDENPYTIEVCFSNDEEQYGRNYNVILNASTLTDSDNNIRGLSNSSDSSKTHKFSENDSVKYFYIENTLNESRSFDLNFVGHTEDAESALLVATLNGGTWSCQKLWLDGHEDYAETSFALNAGAKMYLGYFGNATSVELSVKNIKINKIGLSPNSQQIFKDVNIRDPFNTLKKLYFEVSYEVDGDSYGTVLTPDENDFSSHNLSIEVLFDDMYASVDDLKAGVHTVKCRIPEISNEYIDVGTIEVLSYKELSSSSGNVGTTLNFDKTKTFRDMNYVDFNIPEYGSYKISLIPDEDYKDGDYFFIAGDIGGEYSTYGYDMMSFSGKYQNFEKGQLLIFAKGALNVTVSAVTFDDLKKLYDECKKLNKNDYEEESWKSFSEAVSAAKEFLESSHADNDPKLALRLDQLADAKNGLIEKYSIDLSENPSFEWTTVLETEIVDGTVYMGQYNVMASFQCLDNKEYKKECSVVPGTISSTDGTRSVVYFDAIVTVNEKTFRDRKIITLFENSNIRTETNIAPGAPAMEIQGLNEKEFVEKLLDENEKNYKKITVKPYIINIKPSDDDISKVKSIIKDVSGIDYYDISMAMDIETVNHSIIAKEISNTLKEVPVELEIPHVMQNPAPGFIRNFYVIRVHENDVTRLNATRNGNKLSFMTSLFSTYAVAYVDVKDNTSSPSYPSTPSYPVTDVILSQDKADLTKAGETLQLTATVKPSYADNKTITWKSSDEKVVTVDKDGKVTAVANGTATITATSADGKHSATVTVTVKIAPEKLTLTAENKTLTKVGDSLQITAKIEPDDAYDKLNWKSSDEKVVIVDADGKVTAIGNGEATIIATTEDGKLSDSITITVKIPDEPTINVTTGYGNLKARSVVQTNNSIKVEWSRLSGADGYIVYGSRCNGNGKVYKYKKLTTITNGKTRTWTHTKLKKATYYKYVVKAYKLVNGKKVITDTSVSVHAVTKGGNYGVAKAVSITKIGNKKNVTEITLKKGKTAQITATEVKKDKKIKHHRKLCYESSNIKVATVTANGMIKATGKGSCTIWVYAQNGVYKAITVTVK